MSAIMNFFANFRFNNNVHVVIVGAGYAGVEAATSLDSSFRVTLVEATDSHNHKIASLRAAVMPGWEKRIRLPLDGLLKNGKVIQSKVSAVETGRVTLADQSILECDYVILAHGKGSVNFPCGKKYRIPLINFPAPPHDQPTLLQITRMTSWTERAMRPNPAKCKRQSQRHSQCCLWAAGLWVWSSQVWQMIS